MGCCLSRGKEQHSSYERLHDGMYTGYSTLHWHQVISFHVGQQYSTLNSTQNHVWVTQSTVQQRETVCMTSSVRERELMRELELTKRELEKEKQKLRSNEMKLQDIISSVEKEVLDYRKQLEQVKRQLEKENSEWEALTQRLEMELETEKLKVEARDAELHTLVLVNEQEVGEQRTYLELMKSELESENKALKEKVQGISLEAARQSRETQLL